MNFKTCLFFLLIFFSYATTSDETNSFTYCFDEAVEKVALANCPVENPVERKDCFTNVLANSILPCFKHASDLNLVHLLVPETSNAFLSKLRESAESFHEFSGNEIVIHGFPVPLFLDHLMELLDSLDLFYSGWIVPSSTLASLYDRGVLLELTGNLTADSAFNWQDVASFFRKETLTVNEKVVGVPVSGDLMLLYYRKDIFEQNNVTRPETWEQVLSIAEQFNGTDFNDDGLEDYGTCVSNTTGLVADWIKSIMAPYFQSKGTRQGMMFDSTTMQPLFQTDAMAWVFELFRGLAKLGPYHLSSTNPSSLDLFEQGRCLMILGSEEVFFQYGISGSGDWLGTAELPGSWYVYDRNAGAISRCTTTLCPHGRLDSLGNIINFTPYNGNRSLTAAVHTLSTRSSSEVILSFLSYLGGKSLSFEFVASVSEVHSFRWSHLQIDRWVARGWDYSTSLDYINAMSRSFVSGNIALEPSLPLTLNIDQSLEYHINQIILQPESSQAILSSLEREIEDKIEAYGKEKVLRIYRSSLNLRPEEENENLLSEKDAKQSSSTRLLLGLLLPLLFLLPIMVWCFYFLNGRKLSLDGRPVKPPMSGPQTTLVITDIQDSTTLWETLDADIMDEALHLHNECLRNVLRQNKGYESATEGDSFIIAFHTAFDAIQFCRQAQAALLDVNWPEEIAKSSVCPPVLVDEQKNALREVTEALLGRDGITQATSSPPPNFTKVFWESYQEDNQLIKPPEQENSPPAEDLKPRYLFQGLRVRMGIFTGIDSISDVIMNNVSGRMMYTGASMALAKAISDVGHGGQIIISESTYKAAGLEKLLEDIHVLHLGEYWLSESLPTVQFYEIVAKNLVSRLLHFPHLKAQSLSPAWYQAPSGNVCLSFTFVVGAETLNQWNGKVFREALEIYETIARERLAYYHGYQVEAADGLLLVAFSEPAQAISWALTLHDHLSKAEWPSGLLHHPLCEKLSVHSVDSAGRVHPKEVKGLRLKTGIEQGPAKSTPHPTTGFMAYRGRVINRSARITKFANGGQVLSSKPVWESAQNTQLIQELGVSWTSLGTQKLKGVMETVDVCHLFLDTSNIINQTSIDIVSPSSSNMNSDSEF